MNPHSISPRTAIRTVRCFKSPVFDRHGHSRLRHLIDYINEAESGPEGKLDV